ncbi:MAG TPA: SGNH/GDSL hydrolase family protein [Candidatus Saccharimonadales bacterium]|nr:SGNH/GDSL hydrolase family protein [Candidatus Saccharimonadales bacterium]
MRKNAVTTLLLIVLGLAYWPVQPWLANASSLGKLDASAQHISYLPLGDSYTIGRGLCQSQNWPHQLATWLAVNDYQQLDIVDEPAVSGYTSDMLIQQELPEVARYQPDFVTVMIGTNDVIHHARMDSFRQNLVDILATIRASDPHAEILLANIPDISITPHAQTGIFGSTEELASQVQTANQIIHQVGVIYDVPVADVYDASQSSISDPQFLVRDDFHPNAAGYNIWVNSITQTIIDSQLLVHAHDNGNAQLPGLPSF